MSGCLTISHTCLPCLPSERTFPFWRHLSVVGREVSWERWESSELTRWEMWENSEVVPSERWEGNEMIIWESWEGSEQGRWDRI